METNGDFTFTLLDQIDHLPNTPANDDGQILTIDFSSAIQYTDFDLDTITLQGGFTITVEDDIPVAVTGDTGRVDEDDLTGVGHPGNSDVVNPSDDLADPSPLTVSGSFGVDFGADGPAASAISAVTLTNAVTSDGEAVVVVADGANWVGRAGVRDVFTLSFDTSTGEYTFTLLDNLDHPINSTEDNLQLNFAFVATDFDQDTVNGSFSINVDDDMPMLWFRHRSISSPTATSARGTFVSFAQLRRGCSTRHDVTGWVVSPIRPLRPPPRFPVGQPGRARL